MEKALSRMTEGLLFFYACTSPLDSRGANVCIERKIMLRVKILNVFRADYGVCCTILIYPEEFVLSDY